MPANSSHLVFPFICCRAIDALISETARGI